MPKVSYQQIATRNIEVEATQAELDAIKGKEEGPRQDAIEAIIDRAQALTEGNPGAYPWEWHMSTCLDENDEELFDVG
jgi:hypothetical protein